MIQASLTGRAGKAPRAIPTKTGTPMAAISLAVDVGSYQGDATVWVNVTAFGKQADVIMAHDKGDTIAATGRLELARWTGDDGAERESWRLIAEHVHSVRTVSQGKARGTAKGKGKGRAAETEPVPADDAEPPPPPFDDAIPF